MRNARLNFFKESRIANRTKRKSPFHIKCRSKLRSYALAVYEKYCARCLSTNRLQVDHIYPVSCFPEFEFCLENTQILCKSCNFFKSNKYAKDYRTILQQDRAKWFFDSLPDTDIVKKKYLKAALKPDDLYAKTHKGHFRERKKIRKETVLHQQPKKSRVILRKGGGC